MKIKTGDTVKVISGHYKGTIGEVKAVSPKTNKVIVEGVNVVKKALKPSQQNPDGGIVEQEAPIDASNVKKYDKKEEKKKTKAASKKKAAKKEEAK
jgi:large subunit ribosomal protein L24